MEDEKRLTLFRNLVFWCAIPFLISLQRILNMENLNGDMRFAYLVYSFAVGVFGWAHFHFATLFLAKFAAPASWKSSVTSVLPGYAILLAGAIIANMVLLVSRPIRADFYCVIAEQFNGECVTLPPLSLNWESVGNVFRLTFLNTLYWLIANYVVALLFRHEPYGFRITHDKKERGPLDEQNSPLIGRLPRDIGTDVIAISANQHYIDVHTTQGHTLILYRLTDAIREMGDRGTQIHRSHWVAFDAITEIKREGGSCSVVLNRGLVFPVSRAYRYVLKSDKLPREAIR